MFLEKLILNGFKSFAKPTEFTFQPGIVSVVGPNGSGKSNVADGVRWVLGEQSMKALRGKKSLDVIFSGSDTAGRKGMAEVSLHLNNSDKQMPVDYPEVIITRRLFQDGTSEYQLNGNDIKLSEIQLLLARSNFGQRTYSVIGQGMVDAVLLATPTERREFFEEAAGVKQFQIKKDKALNKLAATWEHLQTARVQLAEIEPRLKSLERQVKRLEKRASIEVQLGEVQRAYYGHTWHSIGRSLEEAQKRVGELSEKRVVKDKEVEALQKNMASLTKESSHSERFEKLQSEYKDLMQRKNSLREKELSLKTEAAMAERQQSQGEVPRRFVTQIAGEIQELAESLRSTLGSVDGIASWDDFEQWRGTVSLEDQKWQRLEQELQPYLKSEKTDSYDKEIAHMRESIERVDGELSKLAERQKELASFEKKERTKIWQIQNILQTAQRSLNEAVARENEAKVEQARLETRLQDVEHELYQEMSRDIQPAELPDAKPDDPEKLEVDMRKLKRQLDLIGGIDPEAQAEYEETRERYDYLHTHVTDLEESMEGLEIILADLDKTIKERFTTSFERIDREFQTFFKQLFNGGKAKLVVVHPERKKAGVQNSEPLQEDVIQEESKELKLLAKYKKKEQLGVEIHATPPGKKLKGISMLSGGERAMTSIALICAIIANNPAPFVVLDEVDAALDEANSMRLADILEQLSHKSQFIVITHNRATMEKAGILYGVTMGEDGISQVLSLKLEEAEEHTNR